MGADLYIKSLSDKARAEHKPAFDAAVAKRGATEPGSAGFDAAQEEVDKAYRLMYGEGYFRDPYNPSSVFYVMGLSWWNDVKTNDEGYLTIDEMRRLIALIEDRPITAERVRDHMQREVRSFGKQMDKAKEWLDYWTKDRADLLAFFRLAIEMNEPVRASL